MLVLLLYYIYRRYIVYVALLAFSERGSATGVQYNQVLLCTTVLQYYRVVVRLYHRTPSTVSNKRWSTCLFVHRHSGQRHSTPYSGTLYHYSYPFCWGHNQVARPVSSSIVLEYSVQVQVLKLYSPLQRLQPLHSRQNFSSSHTPLPSVCTHAF